MSQEWEGQIESRFCVFSYILIYTHTHTPTSTAVCVCVCFNVSFYGLLSGTAGAPLRPLWGLQVWPHCCCERRQLAGWKSSACWEWRGQLQTCPREPAATRGSTPDPLALPTCPPVAPPPSLLPSFIFYLLFTVFSCECFDLIRLLIPHLILVLLLLSELVTVPGSCLHAVC